MVKPELSKTESEARKPVLETRTFFSTLEFAAVPNVVTNLSVTLVQQLQEERNDIYKAIDEHLSSMVHISFSFKDLS